MVKNFKTKLKKNLSMFTLQLRRYDGQLQIVDRISCIKKVNGFNLECQKIKFKERQILTHLCSFFTSTHFYSFNKNTEKNVYNFNLVQQ